MVVTNAYHQDEAQCEGYLEICCLGKKEHELSSLLFLSVYAATAYTSAHNMCVSYFLGSRGLFLGLQLCPTHALPRS